MIVKIKEGSFQSGCKKELWSECKRVFMFHWAMRREWMHLQQSTVWKWGISVIYGQAVYTVVRSNKHFSSELVRRSSLNDANKLPCLHFFYFCEAVWTQQALYYWLFEKYFVWMCHLHYSLWSPPWVGVDKMCEWMQRFLSGILWQISPWGPRLLSLCHCVLFFISTLYLDLGL